MIYLYMIKLELTLNMLLNVGLDDKPMNIISCLYSSMDPIKMSETLESKISNSMHDIPDICISQNRITP